MAAESKTPWTPGPWIVRESPVDPDRFHVQAPRLDPSHRYDIEIMGDDYGGAYYPTELRRADARLISKAPELVALLEVAACPANCIDGAYHGHDGEPIQCQFCYERNALLQQIRGD